MKYYKALEKLYKERANINDDNLSKRAFLSNYIFDYTTYDENMDIILAERTLEVIKHISNKTTFDYIMVENNYLNYITIINMKFMNDKLDWGTSIRGAWFDHDYSGEIWGIKIKDGELGQFMKELLEWSKS